MNKLTMLATALLLTGLLAAPVLAGNQANTNRQQSAAQVKSPGAGEAQKLDKGQPESEGRRLHKGYFQQREAAKKYRDEMLKVRARNVQSEE